MFVNSINMHYECMINFELGNNTKKKKNWTTAAAYTKCSFEQFFNYSKFDIINSLITADRIILLFLFNKNNNNLKKNGKNNDNNNRNLCHLYG